MKPDFMGKGKMRVRSVAAAWAAGAAVLLVGPAGALGAGTQLKLPCVPEAQSSSFLTPCSEVTQQLETDLNKYFMEHIKHLYNGIIPDDELTTDLSHIIGSRIAKPICSYIPGRFVRQLNTGFSEPYEDYVNHKGESCGENFEIVIDIDFGFSWDDGFSMGSVSVDGNVTSPKMLWEWTHVRGMWIQALTWAWEQVTLKEIKATSGFVVSAGNSPVQAQAQAAITEFTRLSGDLEGVPNLSEIRKCELQKWDQEGMFVDSDTKKHDIGQLRQKASYLCAAWKNLQAAVFHLAVSEIFVRASDSAMSNAIDNQQQFLDSAKAYIMDVCQSEAEGCWPSFSVESCSNNRSNACYRTRIREFLRNKLLQVWPLQQLSVGYGGGLGGGFALAGNGRLRRRLRRAVGRAMGRVRGWFMGALRGLKALFGREPGAGGRVGGSRGGLGRGERNAILVAWIALLTSIGLYASGCCDCGCGCGCGDFECPDNTTATREGCADMYKANWESAGQTFPMECCVEQPPADDCHSECKMYGPPTPANPICTPPIGPMTGPSTTPPGTSQAKKAADALARTSQELANAEAGEGDGGATEAESQEFASSTSLATAGNLGSSKKEAKASPTPGAAPSAGPAKRAAGGSVAGGGELKMDPTSTAAAVAGTGGLVGSSSAATEGAVYGGGGSQGGGGGAGGDPGFAYNPGGGGAGAAGEMKFGGLGPSEGDVPAMAGSDPEDYFTRMSPDENIFKKVERKYGEKATSWALEEAKSLLKK